MSMRVARSAITEASKPGAGVAPDLDVRADT
jgi:hypothetical protein